MLLSDSSDKSIVGSRSDGITKTVRRRSAMIVDRGLLPSLRVVVGLDRLRFITLELGHPIVIGRNAECDFRLNDSSISRRHARLELRPGGEVLVEDSGSTNGIAINGVPTPRGVLSHGDALALGSVVMRFDLLSREEITALEHLHERVAAAEYDALTGLRTRAYLNDGMASDISGSLGAGAPVSLIFLDIDHFKQINDGEGHAVGDQVLRDVSRIVLLAIRDCDVAVRYGGDEILILLLGADLTEAHQVAERIRCTVLDHDWEGSDGPLTVTVSAGVAEAKDFEDTTHLIERADLHLYRAKVAGRNQIHPEGQI